MAFLSVAGVTVHVARNQATETVERIGSSSRAYAGNLRSTVRAEKRTWKVTTTPMTAAACATLRAAIALAVQVTCTGDMLPASVTCEVEITDAPYVAGNPVDGLHFRRALVLTLREV